MQISAKECSIRKIRNSEMEDALHLFMRSFRRSDDESLYLYTKKHWLNWQTNDLAEFFGAFLNNKLVGLCLCFPFETSASLGYMVVDLEHQQSGIGSILLKNIIFDLEKRGITSIRLYATKVGEYLYKKFDFQEDFIGSIYEVEFHEEIFQRNLRVRISKRILPWIYSLDKAVYGDNRTNLLRFLIKNGNLIVKGRSGFAFIRDDVIGPVVAKNIPVFIDLLKYAYSLGGRKLYYLINNPRSHKIIEVLHLIENTAMRCIRMIRGKEIQENLSNFYAMYNFAIG